MAIKFECPVCRNVMSAKSEYAGKEASCKCGAAVIVPGDSGKMKFACRQCGKGISVLNAHAGKTGKCPTCQNLVNIPLLGVLIGQQGNVGGAGAMSPPPKAPARAKADTISVACAMCHIKFQVDQSSAGLIKECPSCGSFVEVPGYESPDKMPGVAAGGLGDVSEIEAQGKVVQSTGKTRCPSCERSLADDAPVCTRCGVYVKNGRPILTAWDVDEYELEDKAHGIVKYVSWLIPFGIYPVYSEAMGNHKPYATWAITAITVLVSFWFLAIGISGSEQMMSSKNLMLWAGDGKAETEHIEAIYDYTNYGDAEAFYAKRDELTGTVPDEELDMAALEALQPQQRCFGEFKAVQLITHAFLHGGIMHLAGNMLFLLVLGTRVNAAIGNILTVVLYPILAIVAAVIHLASLGQGPPMAMLGASGAVMGMAGAYFLLFPVHKIYMVIWMRWGLLVGFRLSFKCFAVRGFWVVLFYIMFDIIAVSLTVESTTAHWAHIGGFIGGIVLAFVLLAGRIAHSGSDLLSLILGRHAWPMIGTPDSHIKE